MKNENHAPLVSVLICLRDVEKHLGQAMESVLHQTLQDFELIIVENGSTEESKAILDKYAGQDARIRLVCREGRGAARTANEGLDLARGEFVALMDGDAVSLPERFGKQAAFLRGHPEYVLVGSEVMMIDADGDPLAIRRHEREHEAIYRQCLQGMGEAWTHSAIMIRKSALTEVGGYDPEFVTNQDLDLYLRLCEVGKASNLPETLLWCRQHPQSARRTGENSGQKMLIKAISKAILRRGVDQYLEVCFRHDADFLEQEDFDETCLKLAARGGHWRCAAKHWRRAVRSRGLKCGDLRYLGSLVEANISRPHAASRAAYRPQGAVSEAKTSGGADPTVSVVMPVLNGDKYVVEAVESILGQTFQDFEFIIIDDGSTDKSRSILEDFAARDARIRLVSRENRGLIISLNEAVALARGEFIARMDADDISLPTRFAEEVAFLRAHDDCVIVGSQVLMIDPDGDPLCLQGHVSDHASIDREFLLGNGTGLTHPVVMMRTSALRQIGPYDREVFVEDLDLFLRICEVGKAHNLSSILLRYRQHVRSYNRTHYQKWARAKSLAIRKAIQRRGLERYLEGIFCGAAMTGQPEQSYTEECLWSAIAGGHFRTALKHFRRFVAERGLRWADVGYFALMCSGTIKQKARSFLIGNSQTE
jgi:glycosyltransferase involved in cell wall biosynthesis